MFKSPGEIAVSIGQVHIHWYGIAICAAFLTGLYVTLKIAEYKNFSVEKQDIIVDLSSILLVTGIIGARLYYVIFNWSYYSQHLLETVQIYQGGLSIHGALIGGFLATFVYSRIKKFSLLEFADIYAPGIALGQSIGRWGNFFNSEAFGLPTNLPFKLFIPLQNRPENYVQYSYFHPTFLYESILDFVLFLTLFYLIKTNKAKQHGQIFSLYLIVYSLIRVFIERIRIDSVASVLGIPLAEFISILLIITATGMLYYVTVLKKNLDRS